MPRWAMIVFPIVWFTLYITIAATQGLLEAAPVLVVGSIVAVIFNFKNPIALLGHLPSIVFGLLSLVSSSDIFMKMQPTIMAAIFILVMMVPVAFGRDFTLETAKKIYGDRIQQTTLFAVESILCVTAIVLAALNVYVTFYRTTGWWIFSTYLIYPAIMFGVIGFLHGAITSRLFDDIDTDTDIGVR